MKTYEIVINRCYGGFGLSEEAETWLSKRGIWQKYPQMITLRKLPRHDPLLVECVKTLGDSANGFCATLEVETITSPKYYIDNYDGEERIITIEDLVTIE